MFCTVFHKSRGAELEYTLDYVEDGDELLLHEPWRIAAGELQAGLLDARGDVDVSAPLAGLVRGGRHTLTVRLIGASGLVGENTSHTFNATGTQVCIAVLYFVFSTVLQNP